MIEEEPSEQWRVVINDNNYEVSSLGNVRRCRPGRSTWVGNQVKPVIKNGYRAVFLTNQVSHYVHRLVAMAFIGPIAPRLNINHINSVRTDNRIANLEICTVQQNVDHMIQAGRMRTAGMLSSRAKLTDDLVREMRARDAVGQNSQKIADDLGIPYPQVRRIIRRERWKSVV